MKFIVEHTKTGMLSPEQVNRIIEIAGTAFAGEYEKSIRKDFAHNIEILLLKSGDRIIGFNSFRFIETELNGNKLYGAYIIDLAIERNNTRAIHAILSSMVKLFFNEQEKCGSRFFLFMPIASYHMYRCLSNLFLRYYPNPKYETPAFEKQVMDTFASQLFGNRYDPASCLVKHPTDQYAVRSDIETFTEKELKIPDIAFYKKLNPCSLEGGTELVCLAESCRSNYNTEYL